MKKLYSFRETKAFTKTVSSLLSEESYYAFQDYLQKNYQSGDVIPGGNGLRKIRWRTSDTGKRGGVRVIYYAATEKGFIYLMGIYSKSKQTDLDKNQLKLLTKQIQEWLK